jgi:hypothetical protein
MHSDFWPIAFIVAFVVYPFAMMGVCAWIVSRSGRERLFLPFAKVFAFVGCAIVAWFMLRYGLGKIPSVTIIGSAVFVLAIAVTGGVVGAMADVFVPLRATNLNVPEPGSTCEIADNDANPYRPPTTQAR